MLWRFCGSSPLSFLGSSAGELSELWMTLLLIFCWKTPPPWNIKAAAKNSEKQYSWYCLSASVSQIETPFQWVAALITTVGATVQLSSATFALVLFYPPHLFPDFKRLLFLLQSTNCFTNVSTSIRQVQLLEQPLIFVERKGCDLPELRLFFFFFLTSVSDRLHIFRVFTSLKNVSAWLQSNYVKEEEPHPGRRRHSNVLNLLAWSFWGVGPGYRPLKDPPTVL